MLEMVGALAGVLGLLALLRLALRWQGIGPPRDPETSPRVLGSCAVGTRQRLCVVEASGERMLLGVTDGSVSLLRVLPSRAPAPPAEVPASSAEPQDSPAEPEDSSAEAPLRRSRPNVRLRPWLLAGLVLLAGAAAPAPLAAAQDAGAAGAPSITLELRGPDGPQEVSSALEMLALLSLVTIAPSILLMATCFTRVVVVLAFLRQAIGLQHMPPNQVLIGLALFITFCVMAPIGEQIRTDAYEPWVAKQIEGREAGERALVPVRRFLLASTRANDLDLFLGLSKQAPPAEIETAPLTALLPAYVISELRTAFSIGFMIFLPFLVIDLVVSSMLIAMGMIVLPPIVVSLPFKLMLFVLVDGWNLVLGSLIEGLT